MGEVDELLRELLKRPEISATMCEELVQDAEEMKKRKELLEKHKNKVWQDKNGKWLTYLPGDGNGRRLINKGTKEEVEECIIAFYRKQEETHLFEKVFEEWAMSKLEYGEIEKQTYDRYKTDFERFFRATEFGKKDICKITEDDIEEFIKTSIHEKNLTSKAYGGLRLILNGTFKYAKKNRYTELSITQVMGDMEISKKSFRKTVKKEQVFTDEEVQKIEEYISKHETLTGLGILLAFQTGLRAGELSALQPCDISGDILQISKTEVRYRDDSGKLVYAVRESAKTEAGNRDVILCRDAMKTIAKIRRLNPFGEYLFVKDGERITGKAFTKRLYTICRKVGIECRSLHKARKTYATKLYNGDVDEKIITQQMGHTDISCTKNFYVYNNKSREEAKKQIEEASSY